MTSSTLRAALQFYLGWLVLLSSFANGADWPTWRYDAQRSAASPHELPDELHLQWVRIGRPSAQAWPEDSRLGFDASQEPIVAGKSMFLASSRSHSVTAINTDTGQIRWRFYADGPVRFAPVAHQGSVFFGCDGGNFYQLDAIDGRLKWKLKDLTNRKVLGNDQLISVWPVRGGPVLVDDRLYFTRGIWPFEGTFLYAVNVGSDSHPRSDEPGNPPAYQVTSLPPSAPQGYLAATDGKLLIPRGRNRPLCLDPETNQTQDLKFSSRGQTDYHVVGTGPWVFQGGKIYHRSRETTLKVEAYRPVVTQQAIYTAIDDAVMALDLAHPQMVVGVDRRGKRVERLSIGENWRQTVRLPAAGLENEENLEAWLQANPLKIDIKAGDRLYGHRGKIIFALDLPARDRPAHVSWLAELDGTPATMLAADNKLFVVTGQGEIYCFGKQKTAVRRHLDPSVQLSSLNDNWTEKVSGILHDTGVDEGYALVLGLGSGRLLEELVAQSSLRLIAIDSDRQKVAAARRHFDQAGLYGDRVAVHPGDPLDFGLPPYLANLIVSEDLQTAGLQRGNALVQTSFRSLRPYGGAACFQLEPEQHDDFLAQAQQSNLPGMEIKRAGSWTHMQRVGALPGSADWTHEYGNPSNTLMSADALVRPPLGVLWYGGPAGSDELFYDRHSFPPSMQAIDGRMFIQGPGKMTAVDVYTGRILWQTELTDGLSPGRRGLEDPIGYHFVAAHDALYLAYPQSCLRLNPATGKQIAEFQLPASPESQWGQIRLLDDLLIVPVFRMVKDREKLPVELVAMERHSGNIQWSKAATHSFPVLAAGSGKVFCFDAHVWELYGNDYRRRGPWAPTAPRYRLPESSEQKSLLALDAQTGDTLWSHSIDFVVTWIAYSDQYDVVVVSNGEGIMAFQGHDGEQLWHKETKALGFPGQLPKIYGTQLGYGHPETMMDRIILWHDRVIDQRGPGRAYDLRTGEPITLPNPVTGQPWTWGFTKGGHFCSYAVASEHLLTFRGRSAAFFDMHSGGTGHLMGFRSGCRNSLIPANGVLNAPNFSSGCICNYSIFTSLALVHQPKSELWTYNLLEKSSDVSVERIGLNFGARGDRRDADGTLWVDYPSVGGPSPEIGVVVEADIGPTSFRNHAAQMQGDRLNWIAASGMTGVRTMTIPLVVNTDERRQYTVRLLFAEPDQVGPGERVFSVALQGHTVLSDFDIARETGGIKRTIIREFKGIEVSDQLTVTFTPNSGEPLICGMDMVAEQKQISTPTRRSATKER